MSNDKQPGTAVTTNTKKGPMTIEALFEHPSSRAYIEPYLPKGTDIARCIAAVQMAIKNDDTGKLGQCTPESLVLGVARIQSWSLELGVNAYLLPFKDKAVPVAGYQGLIELMIASGAVRGVSVEVVREGDEFEYEYGLDPILRHKPKHKNTGAITFVYIIIRLPFGDKTFSVMSAADVDQIRQAHSKQWKSGPLPAWYAKKTMIRQSAKLWPKNPKLAAALRVLHQDELTLDELPDGDLPAGVLPAGTKPVDDEVPSVSVREPGQEG